MADEKTLEAVVARVVQRELTYKREKIGSSGSVSIQDEILYLAHNFQNVRQDIAAVKAAVSPETLRPLFSKVLADSLPKESGEVDVNVLADKLAESLLAHIVYEATKPETPTTEGA